MTRESIIYGAIVGVCAHKESPIGGGGQGFAAPSGVPDFGTGGGDDDIPFASCEGTR